MAFGHGVTAREEQILTRWEAGMKPDDIAAELGLMRSTVAGIIGRLGAPGASTAFNDMVRQGSAALLAALRRHHTWLGGSR